MPVRLPVGWLYQVASFTITDSFGLIAQSAGDQESERHAVDALRAHGRGRGPGSSRPHGAAARQRRQRPGRRRCSRRRCSRATRWPTWHGRSNAACKASRASRSTATSRPEACRSSRRSTSTAPRPVRRSVYRLATPVPANWTPLLPVRDPELNLADPLHHPARARRHEALSIRRQRRRSSDPASRRSPTTRHSWTISKPQNDLRDARDRRAPSSAPTSSTRAAGCCAPIRRKPMGNDPLILEEEEVPRIGARLKRKVSIRAIERWPQLALDRAQQDCRVWRGGERAALRRRGQDHPRCR